MRHPSNYGTTEDARAKEETRVTSNDGRLTIKGRLAHSLAGSMNAPVPTTTHQEQWPLGSEYRTGLLLTYA